MTFSENDFLISASLMMEYWYCPRFVYFMEVLGVAQNEDKRLKVRIGREVHQKKALQPEYLRKTLGVVKQEKNLYLSSRKYGICGILDELLFFQDGSLSLLDYKFAYNKHKFKTRFLQGVFYALLVEENYGVPVSVCYVVYTRENNKLVDYTIAEKDKRKVLESISKVRRIIADGYFPAATSSAGRKCDDCTYRNLCIR
ncbi:MAG: CRISPR-associated protein Cas4 [bacterium]|nr:CRISPR-associated protein Cas4 [bacterium]